MKCYFEGSYSNTEMQKQIVMQMLESKCVAEMEYTTAPLVEALVTNVDADGAAECSIKGITIKIPASEVSCCGKKVYTDMRIIVELTGELLTDDDLIVYTGSRRKVQKRYYDYLRKNVRVKHDILEARVVGLREDVVFLDFGYGISSCLSNINAGQIMVTDLRANYKRGDIVKCVLQKPLTNDYKMYITQKPLLGTWEDNVDALGVAVGSTHVGYVVSAYSYGIFVALNNNLVGLADPVTDFDVQVGDTVSVRVREVFAKRNKIKLVINEVQKPPTKNVMQHVDDAYFIDEYKHFVESDSSDVWVYGATYKSSRDVVFEVE